MVTKLVLIIDQNIWNWSSGWVVGEPEITPFPLNFPSRRQFERPGGASQPEHSSLFGVRSKGFNTNWQCSGSPRLAVSASNTYTPLSMREGGLAKTLPKWAQTVLLLSAIAGALLLACIAEASGIFLAGSTASTTTLTASPTAVARSGLERPDFGHGRLPQQQEPSRSIAANFAGNRR